MFYYLVGYKLLNVAAAESNGNRMVRGLTVVIQEYCSAHRLSVAPILVVLVILVRDGIHLITYQVALQLSLYIVTY